MNLLIPHPSRLRRNINPVAALGFSAPARRRLRRDMIQANLKRLHRGWSQIVNRLLGTSPTTVELQLGNRRLFSYRPGTTDLLVLEQVFLDQEYNFDAAPPESIRYIADLGSNIGVTALMWAERFPSAQMVFVEPDPENFALLEKNTAGFRDRCTCIKAAVSAQRGSTSFFRSAREYSHSILKTNDAVSEIPVRTITLSDVLHAAGFPRIDLLKMDIEGGEIAVMPTLGSLRGAISYLIAELHWPYTPAMFAEHCALAGLRAADSIVGNFRANVAFATSAG
jgi:FkbM family methyltransferase